MRPAATRSWRTRGPATAALTVIGSFATGGLGSDGGLGSQGAVTLAGDGRWLLAVNAGRNDISTFPVRGDRGLVLTDRTDAAGMDPVSLTANGHVVCVLDAGGSGNIAGFRLAGCSLHHLAGSGRPLGGLARNPAEIAFSTDGKHLVVTERATTGATTKSRRDEARQIPVRRGTATLRHARLNGPSGAFARIERDRDREMARYRRDRREVALGERTSRDAIRTLGWVARPSGFGFVREDTASAGSPATPCLRQVRQSGTTRMTSRTPHAKDVKRSASAYPLYAGGHRGRDRRQMASNLVEKIATLLGICEWRGRGAATLARGDAGPEGRHQDGPMRFREGAP